MNDRTAEAIRGPRSDYQPLHDVIFGLWGYPAVLVAHDLKLFPLLAEAPRTLQEICEELNITGRPARALMAVCTSLGLLQIREDRYHLTSLAEDYLLESSPTYFGGMFDMMIANNPVWSFESVKKSILTDSAQVYGGDQDWIQTHEEQAELSRAFTHIMHSRSMAPALAWPQGLDLSGHRTLLDVGGGSGAHCIGAALRWPNLRGIVFELATVCEVAEEYITSHDLQSRIRTVVGDLWTDPFPEADVHFYSMIYHDWPPEKCEFLSRKSFESLPSGGRIIVHETLYNDEKTGPFPVAASAVNMLLWTEGEEYSGRELSTMLTDAGFTDIDVQPTFGSWSIVTGRKP